LQARPSIQAVLLYLIAKNGLFLRNSIVFGDSRLQRGGAWATETATVASGFSSDRGPHDIRPAARRGQSGEDTIMTKQAFLFSGLQGKFLSYLPWDVTDILEARGYECHVFSDSKWRLFLDGGDRFGTAEEMRDFMSEKSDNAEHSLTLAVSGGSPGGMINSIRVGICTPQASGAGIGWPSCCRTGRDGTAFVSIAQGAVTAR
jgi:hypothetical protein